MDHLAYIRVNDFDDLLGQDLPIPFRGAPAYLGADAVIFIIAMSDEEFQLQRDLVAQINEVTPNRITILGVVSGMADMSSTTDTWGAAMDALQAQIEAGPALAIHRAFVPEMVDTVDESGNTVTNVRGSFWSSVV